MYQSSIRCAIRTLWLYITWTSILFYRILYYTKIAVVTKTLFHIKFGKFNNILNNVPEIVKFYKMKIFSMLRYLVIIVEWKRNFEPEVNIRIFKSRNYIVTVYASMRSLISLHKLLTYIKFLLLRCCFWDVLSQNSSIYGTCLRMRNISWFTGKQRTFSSCWVKLDTGMNGWGDGSGRIGSNKQVIMKQLQQVKHNTTQHSTSQYSSSLKLL